ncbi:MAG: iron-sulfur cluster-binding domain-containing protein [Chitinophagaceae bacterium]|nr:MAG: iron-sulfur cluster-binding domain-containing protein [Chitinophagaceae bacterium]
MRGRPSFSLTIVHKEELVPGFFRFTFAPQPGLRSVAGQFLTFTHRFNGEEVRRSYSLLSVPGLDDSASIGVRRIDNGLFSRYLCDEAAPGTVLECIGAAGLFVLPAGDEPKQVFLLAAGSGITPVYALLRAALLQHAHTEVVLVYSNHNRARAALIKEIGQLAIDFPGRFRLHLLFSDDPVLRRAHLNRELLLELLQEEGASAEHTWFYTCGPEAYMRMCSYVLRGEGFPADRIRREDFIPLRPSPPPLAPPDSGRYEVRVYWQGRGYRFTAGRPDSILKSALEAGLELPYSCGLGRCASCVARCVEGHTWLARNEVLTEADLACGLTLPCSAFPQDGPVTLRFDDTDMGTLLEDL